MSVFDELNGLASPVEAIVPIFLVTLIVSNDSGDQLVEVGAPVLADLQNGFVHGARTRELPRPKHTNCSE